MDKAHVLTDKLLEELEVRLKLIYTEAYKTAIERNKKAIEKLSEVSKEDDNFKWRTLNQDLKNSIEKSVASQLSQTSEIAKSIIEDTKVNIFNLNYEYTAFDISQKTLRNLNFAIYDLNVIKQIVQNEQSSFTKMAYKGLASRKIIERRLQNELSQSIITGESIPDIAKRIKKVSERSLKDSVRIARTETTRVESDGRVKGFEEAETLGVVLEKQWISTLDMRTRDEHRHLMLEKVPLDKKFSNGQDRPGKGTARQVINCRCTTVAVIKNLKPSAKQLALDKRIENISFEKWGSEYGRSKK